MNSLGSVRGSVRGFTLIELLVAVSIIAILASLAAPSFVSAIANQRIRAASYELAQTLQTARSKAILTRRTVDVRASYPTANNNWNGTKTGTLFSTNTTTADGTMIAGSSFYILESGSGIDNATAGTDTSAISNRVSQYSTISGNVVINATPVLIRFSPDSTVLTSNATATAPTALVSTVSFTVTSPSTVNTGYTVTMNRFGLIQVQKNT